MRHCKKVEKKVKKDIKVFESIYKNGEIIKFGDIETQKQKFHQHKAPILITNIYINKIVVSNKVSFDKKAFKYFIDYKDGKKIKPLCIFLQKGVHIEKTLMKLDIYLF